MYFGPKYYEVLSVLKVVAVILMFLLAAYYTIKFFRDIPGSKRKEILRLKTWRDSLTYVIIIAVIAIYIALILRGGLTPEMLFSAPFTLFLIIYGFFRYEVINYQKATKDQGMINKNQPASEIPEVKN